MPFIAACSYCPHKLQVPDQAVGACICCPKCGNYFTVAPLASLPAKNPRHMPASAPAAPPAPEQPWWVASPPQPASAPEPPAPPLPLSPPPAVHSSLPKLHFPQPLPPPPPSTELPGWINVWGVFAFCFAALALLLAAFSLPRSLSLSLAGIGLLLGIIGAVLPRQEWKAKDALWLALAGGICALLLLVGLLKPGWINDRWIMDFEVPQPDYNKQFVVPRQGNAEGKELSSGERVDAATHAIRQGDILIRIESAEVKRLTGDDLPVLLLTLHIQNIGQLHIIDYHGQGNGPYAAIVRDSRGKELPRRDLKLQAKSLKQIQAASLLPNHDIKDVVAVEAPWNGTSHVDVDLPAAAWGREGACQFTIPSSFLRR